MNTVGAKPIETTSFETGELLGFFLLQLTVVYTSRLVILCQITALILEQFRKVDIMQNEVSKPKYAKYRIKNML